MPTKAIYKPVSDDENDENDVIIFEIDGFDDDDGLTGANGSTEDDAYYMSGSNDDVRAGDIIQPMDISSHSFSDEDFTEHLFGWQEPWFPSILVTLFLVVPVLLGNVWAFYDIFGAWFVSTLFSVHLFIALCTARHLVGSKLSTLASRRSRICTSIASL
jgi:hypothetical protein